jgi:hypothetical protein
VGQNKNSVPMLAHMSMMQDDDNDKKGGTSTSNDKNNAKHGGGRTNSGVNTVTDGSVFGIIGH